MVSLNFAYYNLPIGGLKGMISRAVFDMTLFNTALRLATDVTHNFFNRYLEPKA